VRLLDAHLDGELDATTSADLDTHLARCPECARLHAVRLALGELVRKGRDDRGVPPAVADRIRHALADEERAPRRGYAAPRWPQAIALAAGAAFLAWAATLAIVKRAEPAPDSFAVVERHVVAMAAQGPKLQVVSTERHEVKPWFQGRVPLSPPVPDLADQGFELLGGRVDRIGEHDAAVVVYRIRKHPVELYAWRDEATAMPLTAESSRGFSIARWRVDGLALVAISDVNAQDLERFATLVEARRR
jgi:anti-sigma factor RsiW